MAAIITLLGSKSENDGVRTRLARWYWCGVFGELYGSSAELRFSTDIIQMLDWLVSNGSEPFTIMFANFTYSRLFSLRNRNSAVYKGLCPLLMRDGSLDFRTGEAIHDQMYFDEKIDMHHIFPKEWCKQRGIDPRFYDSIINKTPLSAKTNRMIGKKSPSNYLEDIERIAGIPKARMDEILRSHLIDPATLRSDNFSAFFEARREALLIRIEKAIGKPIPRDAVQATQLEDTDAPTGYEEETDF